MRSGLDKESVFETLYAQNADKVLKTAFRYAQDKEVALDVMQETFMKLYIYMDELDEEYVCGWLLTTARNLSINCAKKKRHEVVEEDIALTSDLHGRIECLEEEVMKEERRRSIRELNNQIFDALYRENVRWYEAATLVYCMEKPQKQVASEIGVEPEVLYSMLRRVRNWIRKNYGDQYCDINME